MKPERLEMAGFAPFRAATEIDLSGLELFALTGPTGSGKSSVIDAITFALYGTVSRYDRRNVEPIISLGAAEARVRFDFEVEDTPYTAVRVVRRTSSGGATTAEARLESDGSVIASGAPEVTRAVESLLGLGIDHFTRSVVLPQGEFAAFLHDTPAGQQDLVKALLDMDVLDDVRRLSTERQRTASALAEAARSRLDALADATDEAEKAAAERLAQLESLVEPVTAAEAEIGEGEQEARALAEALGRLQEQRRLLKDVRMPAEVEKLAAAISEAKQKVVEAEQRETRAVEHLEGVRKESSEVPDRTDLETAVALRRRLEGLREKNASLDLDELDSALSEASEGLEQARQAREQAVAAWEQSRTRHAAHALVMGLGEGDPCPVCSRPLPSDPESPPTDLEERKTELERAEAAQEEATEVRRKAENRLTEARTAHKAGLDAIGDLQERLEGYPAGEELDRLIATRQSLDARLAAAQTDLEEARAAMAEARRRVMALEEREREAWEEYSKARDTVAALAPPAAGRDDLSAAWTALTTWAATEAARLEGEIGDAEAAVQEAKVAVEEKQAALLALMGDNEVGGAGSASARVAAACATATADLNRIRERRQEHDRLAEDVNRFGETAQVAGSLAGHLRANRFEGWLLAEALATLVEGANSLLAELTSRAYSLALRDRSIEIVDHRNADERRSVRSLSGGETFLVSLALALSLGEQLTNLSERGGARLEAIFLDEGFGTLDAETLETVTAVVTELAAGGRIVGVVTHVKELAEQIPVRFEVRPGPTGSTIERIET